jgi:hypothetical protein
MAIVPVRGLGQFGVLTDPDPYDLPPSAFSFAVNTRFRNGHVTRGPLFRNVRTLDNDSPRFVSGNLSNSGTYSLFLCYLDGTVSKVIPTAETDYSASGYSPSDSEGAWTSTHVADVFYINREDRVPWSLTSSDSQFHELANWDPAWSCKLLRSCGGALVALNVTQSGSNYPTMVKTSSFPQAGAVPDSWDIGDPASLATENILAEMEGAIIDADNFGNDLFIYGLNETWRMRLLAGSTAVWDYERIFGNHGAINANCSIEVGGQHFVFGPDDIWTHDGVSQRSICEGKTRDFIYGGLDPSKRTRCFVSYNPRLKQLHFNYCAADIYTPFFGTTGCNRSAVYSLVDSTWTFDDLPSVFSGTLGNLDGSETYASTTATYDMVSGTYLDREASFKRAPIYVGDDSGSYGLETKMYVQDLYGAPAYYGTFDADSAANKAMYLERDGIDLDELGKDLRGYVVCQSVYPEARVDTTSATLQIAIGSSDYFGQAAEFGDYVPYNGAEEYKLDFGKSGRYLSMRILYDDYRNCSLSGLDCDFDVQAAR